VKRRSAAGAAKHLQVNYENTSGVTMNLSEMLEKQAAENHCDGGG
jgi:hypothetical protein